MFDPSFYKQKTMPDFHEEGTLPLPVKVGPYKIESLLSKGGMSFLYLGLHPQTRETLAIKVLSPKYVTDQDAIERFLKESQIIAMSNHPNIIKLFGQGEWEDGLYIAMEFIRGVSLRQFILQQSLSLRRTLDIVLQVAYALCHLHSHGIIHRDLKPENILITEEGEIKVIDFGIAQLHDEKNSDATDKTLMGTPNYMSPEQKEDYRNVSFSSDIYSLGIIAYELILGKLSYGVINLSLLPKGLQTIIKKCLAISVKERYQDIVDFISEVSQYLKSGTVEKDKPETDALKELLETFQKTHQAICLSPTPDWQQIEIGIAKVKDSRQMGLYYDFIKFPNNLYVLFLAQIAMQDLDSAIRTAVLKGMIKMAVYERIHLKKEQLHSIDIVSKINEALCSEGSSLPYALSFLLLDPDQDKLSYISCGLGSLFHVLNGQREPRQFVCQNPLLGVSMNQDFVETTDNWNVGDILILQSLDSPDPLDPSHQHKQTDSLKTIITENLFLSAERQAETILKRMSLASHFHLSKRPEAVISIQRMG